MVTQNSGLRKQRTREHIIADQSVNFIERFILDEGHTSQPISRDYGYDLIMFTYDAHGFIEPGFVYFQLKASQALTLLGREYVYDIDIRDFNLWMQEKMPVVLVLFDASRRRAYWISIKQYFHEDSARLPAKGQKTIRVRIPPRQIVNRRNIQKLRFLKQETRLQLREGEA